MKDSDTSRRGWGLVQKISGATYAIGLFYKYDFSHVCLVVIIIFFAKILLVFVLDLQ